MSRIIAIGNNKGGSAKTTTAVNFAVALAERNFKVLLIDTDPQGDATFFLTGTRQQKRGIYEFFKGWDRESEYNTPYQRFVQPSLQENLWIIPSSANSKNTTELIKSMSGDDLDPVDIYDARIVEAAADFDFTIIDTRPTDVTDTEWSIEICNYLLVTSKRDALSINGAKRTMSKCFSYIDTGNYEIRIVGVLLCDIDKNSSAYKQNKTLLTESEFSHYLFQTEIRRSNSIDSNANEALPIVLGNKRTNPAVDYENFTDEFLRRLRRLEFVDEIKSNFTDEE